MTILSFTSSTSVRGFTLVETLVAIAILMLAITVPFYSVQQSINASNAARDQLVASSLAQEAAEYIYYLRDTNYLSTTGWLTGMDNCLTTNAPYGCVVDPSQNTLTSCTGSGCPVLNISGSNLYTQTAGTGTRFTRKVQIEQLAGGTQAKVTVLVTFSSGHHTYSVTVVENLYNWL
ncbi:MAG: seg [Parcubacteria group bacterium]|nr:seg [Parcubacteria group bacterium]